MTNHVDLVSKDKLPRALGFDGQVDRTSASEAVDAGSNPVSDQAEDFRKLAFTASLLGVQHLREVWRKSWQVRLLCPWERH